MIASICIGLAFLDLARLPHTPSGLHARGLITEVDNSHVRQNLIVKTEAQFLTVRLLDGPHEGQEISITNMLTGKMEFDEFYEAGKTVLVEYDTVDGKPRHGVARGTYRLQMQIVLIGLFGLLLLVVAGVTGLKAVLSFVFAAMVLWKLFLPLLLGFPPLSTGLGVVAATHRRDHLLRRRANPARNFHVRRFYARCSSYLLSGGVLRQGLCASRGRSALCRNPPLLGLFVSPSD